MADTQVTITIENLSPEAGTFLTPFWVGFHNGDFDTYDRGRPISPGLERLVEDGNTEPFSEEFAISGDGSIDGTITGAEGIEGPIDPGEVVTQTFTIDSEDDTSQFFSYASMIIPSNDAFVSNGNPTAHSLFDEEGNFIGADFIILGNEVLDGGTEVNDEEASSTAFFSQEEADTGEVENGVVTTHPGFIEDGRILTEDGTTEGAPAAFTNADFTADGYQVARVTVSVGDRPEEPVNITATLNGEQEVDGGDEDATGTSTLTLNDTGEALEYSLSVTGLDFGANGLIEGGATTEETSDDVTRLHIHNAPSGENGDIVFALFDTVQPELGDILDIPGNQDEDLVVTANDDGSVTLTGVWEESDPAVTALSEFVPEIRDTEAGEEIDLYWNVHTEEFPAGAIRGQLEVAEEPIPVADPVSITSTLNGEQEVDGGDEDATGTSTLTLNDTGEALEYSLSVTGLDFGANGLIEGGATTEETSDDVTRLHIHNAPSGENGDIVFALFDTVQPELGDILDIPGNQDEDLVVTANDDGSVTLTGVWEESDPAVTALSEFVPEIRDTEAGEEIDLYWNVHTEEFPAGAIRGQLEVAEEDDDTIDLFRFRNTTFDTGTYVFVGEEERDFILNDENLSNTFALDGAEEDGTINPAFTASTVEGDDLIPFFRLESLAVPGTFLFVSTAEYDAIFAEDSNQADQWTKQGFDESGENDVAEFFLFDSSADMGIQFTRFQNNQNNTYLFAGEAETQNILDNPDLANAFTNQGDAFESLIVDS